MALGAAFSQCHGHEGGDLSDPQGTKEEAATRAGFSRNLTLGEFVSEPGTGKAVLVTQGRRDDY